MDRIGTVGGMEQMGKYQRSVRELRQSLQIGQRGLHCRRVKLGNAPFILVPEPFGTLAGN